MEYVVHEPLKCGRGVPKAKRHHAPFKRAVTAVEGRFGLIFGSHRHLMVSISKVELREYPGALKTRKKLVYPRYRKGIGDRLRIEGSVVYTHA